MVDNLLNEPVLTLSRLSSEPGVSVKGSLKIRFGAT